jgi:hypothetical protein
VGISFASVFILVYHVFFWVFGLAHSLSWDYEPGVPQGEAANVRVSWREKPIGGFVWRQVLKIRRSVDGGQVSRCAGAHSHLHAQVEPGTMHPSRVLDEEEASVKAVRGIPQGSVCEPKGSSDQSSHDQAPQTTPSTLVPAQPEAPSRLRRVLGTIAVVVTPISAIVVMSLVIVMVEPLKALFVDFEGRPPWKGPDGNPPLAFVMDTGSSILLISLRRIP